MEALMIDLETFSLRGDNAAVASIGWAVFDPFREGIKERGLYQTEIESTAHIAPDVIFWWLTVPAHRARIELGDRSGEITLEGALLKLQRVWSEHGCEQVWANGLLFDISILQYWYRKLGRSIPWAYNQARDMRFVRDLLDEKTREAIELRYTPHSAVDDACMQAEKVQAAYRLLRAA